MEPDLRDQGALLTTLTTEHFTLQGARSGTITESLGRSTIYLGSLFRPFFSIASVIAVINSMVAGTLGGITLDVFVPRTLAVIAGVVLAVAALIIHFQLGRGRFVRAMESITPQFPSART